MYIHMCVLLVLIILQLKVDDESKTCIAKLK